MARSSTRRTRIHQREFDAPKRDTAMPNRLSYCLISMLLGGTFGAMIDMLLAVMRSITQPESGGTMIWIFVWIIGACGALMGYRNGSKAADVYMGATPDDVNTADQFIIRVISKTIIFSILLWSMLMIFF